MRTYYDYLTPKWRKPTMFDAIVSLPKLLTLHPIVRDEAVQIFEAIDKAGIHARCVYGVRTFAEQDALYQQGRTIPGKIVTNAKAGLSYHNYGLAFDFCLLHGDKMWSWDVNEDVDHDGKKDWLEVIEICEQFGWEAGFRWTQLPDGPHLQKTLGHKVQDLFTMYTTGQVHPNGYLIL